jgi:hypothetical protein
MPHAAPAGLYHSFERWKKPFNPILGETWQAALSDGSTIAMEQISHHPPVSAFQIEGPGSLYRFVGLSQPSVTIMLKAYGFKTQVRTRTHTHSLAHTRNTHHLPVDSPLSSRLQLAPITRYSHAPSCWHDLSDDHSDAVL